MKRLTLLSAVVTLAAFQDVEAAFLRVDPSGGGDYLTVAAAMAAAADDDTVAVIAGLHNVTNVEVHEGVQLLGGWNPSFTSRTPGASHLHTGSGSILKLSSGQSTETLIDGFELTGASTSAISLNSSSATITNNDVHDNYGQDGAAIHCEYGSSSIIENNHIHHNNAVYGAGIRGHFGSANSMIIRNNLIEYNSATSAGGGIGVNNGSPLIEENLIRFNDAEGTGGGIHVWHAGGGTVSIRRNLILFNTCRDGAGIGINGGHPIIENNTIWGNDAWRSGGAISQAESLEPSPETTYVRKNILGGSTDGAGVECINEFDISLECNCVFGNADGAYVNCPPPSGDFYGDPLFCDLEDFEIRSNSPCRPSSPTGCDLVGAENIGCGPISVTAMSWGQIKANYR